MKVYDTIVIGGGQAGLSVAYFLRRHQLDYLVLDDQERAGGSWLQTWESLKLFSPTAYSSLSGWRMPKGEEEYPSRNDFIAYMEAYEKRYEFPIRRNIKVIAVYKEEGLFRIETTQENFYSKTLVSATGIAQNPFIPIYPNQTTFNGIQMHSSEYNSPDGFKDKKVIVVGGGNSGAQILAEVSKVAQTTWVTLEEPTFLPDDIDGRYLFNEANRKFYGKESDRSNRKISLSNIVVVESIKEARNRNVFKSKRPFKAFYEEGVVWPEDKKEQIDIIIWCTGFKANIKHLAPLGVIQNLRIATKYTRSIKEPNLWLVGYGSWTGFASATIYGVGKTARITGAEINETLKKS
ncbi:MAG: ArsO family NAD(P)H-dependent flavin-containing monooxygenase [Chitinophagales bacterium]|nr:ArsO family NAD(P)H-dependent flavin-containing monooxygenase [Chitinophagales bacterium]